jgi:hypothetical protein
MDRHQHQERLDHRLLTSTRPANAKGHRGVATRDDKRVYMFRGTVDVASIKIWLRDPSHDPRDRL